MAAPANEFFFDPEMIEQANQHWRQRTSERERNMTLVNQKRYDEVEPKERLAKRVNRLLDKVKESLPGTREALPKDLRELVERGRIEADEIDNDLFERVVGETRDFLSVEFLDKGLQANRCVGRIVTRLNGGRVSYGTGFLVSSRLLLTNWHVLRFEERAANSTVEFDYQLDRFGTPLAVQRFALAPSAFFLNDKALDFALVAVEETSTRGTRLGNLGWCPLIQEEGKIAIGNSINIIQHPRGEMKQIVLRENKLVDLLEIFAHYEGDTEPGSSGSPVFNDQWEVVALHHSGVPRMDNEGNLLDIHDNIWQKGDDPSLLAWIGNEGIRVSRLVNFIINAKVRDHEKKLRDEMLTPRELAAVPIEARTEPSNQQNTTIYTQGEDRVQASTHLTSGTITITIPLTITVSLGSPSIPSQHQQPSHDTEPSEDRLERVEPDPDYENRPGYDPDFLGLSVPLPKLMPSIRNLAVEVNGDGANQQELKYYHYSVLMNRERRLAFVAAVNYHADAPFVHQREDRDRWFLDPRISEAFQTDEDLYAGNPLDRGHLVRRADAAWGNSKEEAKLANDDTFHFPNCSPQHEIFNQSSRATRKGLKLWGNLEEHIAQQGRANNKKLCIFNGPVFRLDDRRYRGVRLPREFWKVLVFQKGSEGLSALAFLLSQESLIRDLPEEEFEVGSYRTFQVRVRELENKTKLDFGTLNDFDPLEDEENESFFEAGTEAVPLESLKDVIL